MLELHKYILIRKSLAVASHGNGNSKERIQRVRRKGPVGSALRRLFPFNPSDPLLAVALREAAKSGRRIQRMRMKKCRINSINC